MSMDTYRDSNEPWIKIVILVSGRRYLYGKRTCKHTESQKFPLQWHHNERDGVLYHRRLGCLLDRLFTRRSKKTSKALRHWPLWGSNAENTSIWWRHHVNRMKYFRRNICIYASANIYIRCDNDSTPLYSDVTCAAWRLKSTAYRLFA